MPWPPRCGTPGSPSRARSAAAADPQADVVLLTVPDAEIEAAAAALTRGRARFVGHCSGATTLAPLAGREAFSLHPLMTVPAGEAVGARPDGRPAARRRRRSPARAPRCGLHPRGAPQQLRQPSK